MTLCLPKSVRGVVSFGILLILHRSVLSDEPSTGRSNDGAHLDWPNLGLFGVLAVWVSLAASDPGVFAGMVCALFVSEGLGQDGRRCSNLCALANRHARFAADQACHALIKGDHKQPALQHTPGWQLEESTADGLFDQEVSVLVELLSRDLPAESCQPLAVSNAA